MVKFIYLAAGGITGTLARYYLSDCINKFTGIGFPYGTLVVNLSGCFLIGLFSGLSSEKFLGPDAKVLLMVGFCGAYTTFSTFIFETDHLIKYSEWLKVFGNVFLSLLLGLMLFRLGVWLGKLI